MKSTSNTVQLLVTSSNNLLPYIEYCKKHRIPWVAIANACGIESQMLEADQWLPTNDVLKYLHHLELAHGKKIGIDVGQLATIDRLAPNIDKLIESVEDLDSAIHILISEITSLSNHVTIWVELKHGEWWLCHRSCYRPTNLGFEQSEWFRTSALVRYCQHYLGDDWQSPQIKMMSSQSYTQELASQHPNSALTFDAEYGALSIPLDSDYRPLDITQAQPDWFESLEKLIRTYSILPWFSIEWFSEMLGTSKRTLQRNLKTQQLVFKDLKEEARFNKAKALLLETDLSVQEISWQVGYADLSNFNRAFKKWANVTAPAYRNYHRSKT